MNAPLSNPILTSQAELIAQELGMKDFTASVEWIERFKRRHGIALRTVSGEVAAVDCTVTNAWKEHDLPSLLKEYREEDIFNPDETGSFYKCLPDKTLALKGERCTRGKKAKERMTVLIAVNMSGMEKLPLLVTGKLLRPRCMKNVKNLPVEYTAYKKVWMTGAIFENWLQKLDRKFLLQGRFIATVVDNCPAHPNIDDLRSIKFVFLPPNTTSHLQPCDQDIINSFKHHYRTRTVRKYLNLIKDKMSSAPTQPTSSETFRISVLGALYDMRSAWDKVTEQTIKNCFRHTGFLKVR
ncbi:tigger transposable element-derived protein [Plakobranchus ocellatus]|uniref:Tigger transposable element-derived protein n=1 Tax=Plakobranchus ocellatus TaxID=259542 RepID=A0AAV4DBF3_9GAST|nr:tigger transposable element-derived protein [Plakobranchus ocellatus]